MVVNMKVTKRTVELLSNHQLLGEHFDAHCLAGRLSKNLTIKGWIEKGLVDVKDLKRRHKELEEEMKRRNMKPKKPFPEY